MHILDIAQNSVRAGAGLVEILITEDTVADRMDITIHDDGCGMSTAELARVCDPFFTTRTTRKVGLGVPFFRMAAEMAGGGFSIDSRPGGGTVVHVCFQLSHIDRMPLGDMAATFTVLAGGSPGIEFLLRHRVDGNDFTADTREFRRLLDGVPLESPEILLFIGDYIREHTAALCHPDP